MTTKKLVNFYKFLDSRDQCAPSFGQASGTGFLVNGKTDQINNRSAVIGYQVITCGYLVTYCSSPKDFLF